MNKLTIITVIYLVLSGIYNILGYYALLLNRKNITNRLFFILSHALSFWAFCFAMRNFTNSQSLSLFWTRISVFGWGTMFALIYHFITALRDAEKKHSIWFYLLVYGSSAVNIVLFFFYPIFIGEPSYNIFTEWGWTVLTPPSFKEMYYNSYYAVFSVLTYIQLYKWYKESRDSYSRSRIRIISLSLIFVAVFGIPTEIIFNRLLVTGSVQTMVIWMALPLFAMYYTIQKYRFLHQVYKVESNQVVDDQSRNKIFQIVGYLFIFSSYAILLIYFLSNGNYVLKRQKMIFSVVVYIIGATYLHVNYIFKTEKLRYWFLTLTGSAMIYFSVALYTASGAVTSWATYFVFIIISVVFEDYIYGLFMTMVLIAIQVYQWLQLPSYLGVLDWTDYAIRIAIILMTYFVVTFIGRLYYNKNNEIYSQMLIEETLTEATRIFINVSSETKDQKIDELLALCNKNLKYARAYLCTYLADDPFLLTHYCETEQPQRRLTALEAEQQCALINSASIKKKLLEGQPVIIDNFKSAPLDENIIKQALDFRTIYSLQAFPTVMDNAVVGVLVFENSVPNKWDINHDYKRILANLIIEAHKRIKYELKLQKSAYFDEVTGLYKKRRFVDIVSSVIEQGDTSSRHAMLFIDIDNFKKFNDVFGHYLGDAVLVKMADIIRRNSRKEYIAARFGGDEFIVFLPDVADEAEVIAFVENIIEQAISSLEIDGHELRLSISIGVAKFPCDGTDIETMLKNADLAMYDSKRWGKGGYSICSPTVKNVAAENVSYTSQLAKALQNNQFRLVYQPQISVKTGKIVGAEALLRWHSKDFDVVSPLKFIPLLEHSGLINEVGAWVIEQAALQQSKMAKMGYSKLRISVNLSLVQFQNELLFKKLHELVHLKGIDPTMIELEITESMTINETNNLIEYLSRLKALGYRIAIDDFGIDFSSLQRLQISPIDRLKIDKSFINGIGVDDKKEKVALVIINMAKSLGMMTTAEGVHKREQVDFLMNTDCDEIQGFYYSQPLYPDEFEAFTKSHY